MFKQIPHKKVRLGLLLVICLLGAALLPAVVVGRPRVAPAASPPLDDICTEGTTFSLETKTGYMQTPDGNSLFMWTFANAGGSFQVPSPVLCVTEDDNNPVTVNLTNNLPVTTSIIFPGQTGVTSAAVSGSTGAGPFTLEAGPGAMVSYSFVPKEPGTYLYESGTNPHQQVEMGLYGALIIRPKDAPNQAYADSDTAFDQEFLLLIHDMDPDLHKAVERNEDYDATHRRDHYWTINGRSFPDSIADNFVPWLPQQPYGALVTVRADPDPNNFTKDPALIRYINAGLENHPFHPHGNHMRVIGRDGRPLSLQPENFTTTIGSGQTYDLLFRWVNVDGWDANTNPIKDTITLPHLLNLVYKDGLTWFSSDPDLGVKADYPPGTTTFNECGEFYFPWHSHALNEFQNFDEGFGGLATLVRVDPPGGCP